MDNRYKFLFKNTALLTIGNFSSKILVFLMVPLYTSVLTTEEYGVYDLLVATVQLLMPIITINIVDAVMRFGMERNVSKKSVVTIGVKYLTISVFSLGIILLINRYLSLWEDLLGYTIYVFLYYVSWIANHLAVQFAKALECVKDIAIAGVMSTTVTIVCNLLFLIVFDMRLIGFFLAYVFGQAIPAMYLFYRTKIHNYIGLKTDKKLEREMVQYSFPLIMTNLAWNINSISDRYIVTWLCGVAINGIYSVSYKIPTIITTVQSIFTQAWSISAIKEYDAENKNEFYQNMFSYLNTVMCIGSAFLIMLTKPIAYILYAKEFYNAWQYVPFLVISCVINSAAGYIGQILVAKKDTKSMAKAAIYGAIVNIILNIIFIYFIGAQGASIATAISSFVIFSCRKKSLDEVFKLENYWKILISWCMLAVQGLSLIYVGVWWMQIFAVMAMLFLYRKDVMNILSKMVALIKR